MIGNSLEIEESLLALRGQGPKDLTDLSVELGIPGENGHQKIQDAVDKVIAACKKHKKFPGMGGAYISLVRVPQWTDGITAGAGWIALAIVVFAAWRPWRAAGSRCGSTSRSRRRNSADKAPGRHPMRRRSALQG